MKIKDFLLLFTAGISFGIKVVAQPVPPNPPLSSLQHFVTTEKSNVFDSAYNDIHYLIGENLNYLYPIYQLLGANKKFINEFSSPAYYELLSQTVSFVGDYSGALEYQHLSDTTQTTDV